MIQSGIYWTLAVEEQFYMLIPLVLYLFIKYTRKYLPIGLISLILLGISIRFILYDASKDWDLSFLRPFHTRFDNLLFGVLAAFLFISYKDKLENISYKWKILTLLIPLISLGMSFLYGGLATGYFNVCWQFTLTGLGFSTIILYVILFPFSSYTPPSFQKFIGLIAKFSYTMYLYHVAVLYLLIEFVYKYFSGKGSPFYWLFGFDTFLLNFLTIFFIYFLATFLISSFFYWLIDRPCMNYRRKILAALEVKRNKPIKEI